MIDPKGEIAAFCDATDHWLPLICTMNVALATDQARELFGWDIPTMEERVEAVPAGAGGILFLPYLQGERTPNLPKARAIFHGLTTENMKPDFMARAVVEGVMLGLAYGLRRFKEVGIVPTEIRSPVAGAKARSGARSLLTCWVFRPSRSRLAKARPWAQRSMRPGPTVR